MIGREEPKLSLVRQCALLGISRSSLYYLPTEAGAEDLELMANTSKPNPGHKVYPYLLRGLEINRVNQVWATDITYIPMARGFLYLVAIMDWHSRYVLAWRLSNTLEVDFCVAALEEALSKGRPQIFNTDQGSQFTSEAFTSMLLAQGVQVSMDGRGRCMDNVFVERLWRSIKYEEVYLKAYQNGTEARKGIGAYLAFYNQERPHQALWASPRCLMPRQLLEQNRHLFQKWLGNRTFGAKPGRVREGALLASGHSTRDCALGISASDQTAGRPILRAAGILRSFWSPRPWSLA